MVEIPYHGKKNSSLDVYYVEHQSFIRYKNSFLNRGESLFKLEMSMRVNHLLWNDSMEKTEYIFIGAGGHARVLASVIESNQDKLIAVFDDNLNINELDGVKNEGEYQQQHSSRGSAHYRYW